MLSARTISLSKAAAGKYRIVAMANDDVSRRLSDIGLRIGIRLEVMANHGANGIVVGCCDVRLALDRETAEHVRVVSPKEKKS